MDFLFCLLTLLTSSAPPATFVSSPFTRIYTLVLSFRTMIIAIASLIRLLKHAPPTAACTAVAAGFCDTQNHNVLSFGAPATSLDVGLGETHTEVIRLRQLIVVHFD